MTSLAEIQAFVGVAADGKWGPDTANAIARKLGIPSDNFPRWLPHILKHEGGYVNHPKDPGGATNKGVTQRTYDDWRARKGQPQQSVRNISDAEVSAIYRNDYWDAVKGDQLPSGLAYCVFDFAVNSGVNRSSRFLQTALGVPSDGKVGPQTIAAANSADSAKIINTICDNRLAFLQSLDTWGTFGKGWTSRVSDARKNALGA